MAPVTMITGGERGSWKEREMRLTRKFTVGKGALDGVEDIGFSCHGYSSMRLAI
jgi:hypothetical protein